LLPFFIYFHNSSALEMAFPFFFSAFFPHRADSIPISHLISGSREMHAFQGEESLCRSGRDVLIVVVYSSRILGSKNDKQPAVARSVVGRENGSPMKPGVRSTRITFEACIRNRRKCMARGLSTENSIGKTNPSTSSAMLVLSKNTGCVAGSGFVRL
jgi:hypothetical protein